MLVAIFSTGIITIIVSTSRLWALAQYGNSTNPIYDNVLSGIFSPLELNVGIICMCMPAFRRFVARFLPTCFGSTFGSSNPKYRNHDDDDVPNARVSSGRNGRRKQDTLGGSLFQTNRTVDSTKGGGTVVVGEDEFRLVQVRKGEGVRDKTGEDESSQHAPDSLYQAR